MAELLGWEYPVTWLLAAPPRSHAEHLVSSHHLFVSLAQGSLVTLAIVAFYMWSLSAGTVAEEARTLAFIVLVTANAALILPTRSPHPEWHQTFAALSPVIVSVLAGTLLSLAIIVGIPAIAAASAFHPPSVQRSLMAFITGTGIVFLLDAAKMGLRKLRRSG